MRWLCVLLVTACSAPPVTSDWERQQGGRLAAAEQSAPPPPPFPEQRNLVGFDLLAPTDMRHFVDASSLEVGAGVVRYVVVVRSPQGADNVSYEALRCSGEYRQLALGRDDGGWTIQSGSWRGIPRMDRSVQYSLSHDYFCPRGIAVNSAREALEALRAGGHSSLKQY